MCHDNNIEEQFFIGVAKIKNHEDKITVNNLVPEDEQVAEIGLLYRYIKITCNMCTPLFYLLIFNVFFSASTDIHPNIYPHISHSH